MPLIRSHPRQMYAQECVLRLYATGGLERLAERMGISKITAKKWLSDGIPANRVADVLKDTECNKEGNP